MENEIFFIFQLETGDQPNTMFPTLVFPIYETEITHNVSKIIML